MVPVDHLDRVVPDLLEIGEERRIVECRDEGRLERAVPLDRVGLDFLVPPPHVVAPELLRKDFGRGCRPAPNLGVQAGEQHEDRTGRRARRAVRRADRHELPVAEVVDEPHPQRVEQQAVPLGAFAEAAGERVGHDRARVPGGRLGEVGLFELPGPGPGSLEFNRRHVDLAVRFRANGWGCYLDVTRRERVRSCISTLPRNVEIQDLTPWATRGEALPGRTGPPAAGRTRPEESGSSAASEQR